MKRGRILVLNGNSSSGKTTLANALLDTLPERYELVGLDRWLEDVPSEMRVIADSADHEPVDGFLIPMRDGVLTALPSLGPAAVEILRQMYSSFAARADSGTNLIVDDVLWHPAALALAIAHFADRDAWLIGVLCPIAVAVERERRRIDRAKGGAALFGTLVHAHGAYDLTVDTSVLSPQEAASLITGELSSRRAPMAFRTLRSRMGSDASETS